MPAPVTAGDIRAMQITMACARSRPPCTCGFAPSPSWRSPSCRAVPANGQYVALGYGASISQAVPTVPGKLYQFDVYESMEGVCNIAYSEIDTYWNSALISSTTTPATGRTPDAGDTAWGAYDTYTPTFIAKSATSAIRIVATTEAFSCAFDVANASVTVKPSPTLP
jgi:hypothetical protein